MYIRLTGSMTEILTRTHGTGPDTSTVQFRPSGKCDSNRCPIPAPLCSRYRELNILPWRILDCSLADPTPSWRRQAEALPVLHVRNFNLPAVPVDPFYALAAHTTHRGASCFLISVTGTSGVGKLLLEVRESFLHLPAAFCGMGLMCEKFLKLSSIQKLR